MFFFLKKKFSLKKLKKIPISANLNLAAVNLPGGELRRRGTGDELLMRRHLKEGDLILAEVQKVREDGYLNLHTRSLKYGKLGPGVLIIVSPSLIRRRKNHVSLKKQNLKYFFDYLKRRSLLWDIFNLFSITFFLKFSDFPAKIKKSLI